MPPPHPDAIADCVLNAFHALPNKSKPRRLADGRREWVPLAGIVLTRSRKDGVNRASTSSNQLTCAALATGMKCLPQNKLAQAKGNVLHDCHAEVLAIRTFDRFLVDECADLARTGFAKGRTGAWLKWRKQAHEDDGRAVRRDDNAGWHTPFELQEDVTIHMYCSEAPCGDASMELIMAAQEDTTPWTRDTPDDMLGRGHFDRLGIVRRKPARPDAPISLSKSCSDKLAMKQCTSLLSGLTSTLMWPGSAYLSTLVLPQTAYVPVATERAFGATGRMAALGDAQHTWSAGGYSFSPFEVATTSREFEYSKRSMKEAVPSNLSAVVTLRRQEILINGVLQGRKQDDPKGASCTSRRRLWEDSVAAANAADLIEGVNGLQSETYGEVKGSRSMEEREKVKRDVRTLALHGWHRNLGDEDWGL